jgi:hypothetical protein
MSGARPDDRDILLRQAANEIRHLRTANNVLNAQMFVVEAFHAALCGPPRPQGVSPDLVGMIERHLNGAQSRGDQA